jgi:hypothetical protein
MRAPTVCGENHSDQVIEIDFVSYNIAIPKKITKNFYLVLLSKTEKSDFITRVLLMVLKIQ